MGKRDEKCSSTVGFEGNLIPLVVGPPLSLAASLDFKVFKLSSRDLAYSSIHPPSTRKSHCPENQSGACGREFGMCWRDDRGARGGRQAWTGLGR